ncbi:BN860_05028g1_1 [Zygosaccharomyces bailii CLIB 213]|uniref:BN860_05028g1_1 n=1 Tax=Zygosaccharomyces bailii (strain CLIB 213 / ATCC 58445 / CBS 680 / BCRC 21525 / NBRC 1098 / NCYC 1416 / NRRL Y-2227) TaxID=1333698 RepID=A0A8J2T3T1_ZYGB2|nr:BN860_05028g1_1 [Zygosaccharomyces bailii CLIB 213]
MQQPGDDIIQQLTNVSASQFRSPRRTPETHSAGSTPSRDGSITPSPSSRGKKWTERLAKFQRHSDKKKTTISPSSCRTVSMSPVVSQTISPNGNLYGQRTSSLPRPPQGFESGVRLSPPKIGSFGHKRTSTSSKKSFLNEYCTVCDEPVLNRSSGERIVELECGHISHQECLLVSFEGTTVVNPTDFFSIFPPCTKCRAHGASKSRCIPKNDELKDRLISIFLIGGNGRRHSEPSNSPLQSMPTMQLSQPPMLANLSANFGFNSSIFQSPRLSSPRVAVYSQALPSPQQNLRTPGSSAGGIKLASVPFRARNQSEPHVRRDLPIAQTELSAAQSIVRDSVISLGCTENYSSSTSDKLLLYLLRSYFIGILLKNFSTLSDWKIDDEFGLLRLVDNLMVSKDGHNYQGSWCMLFEKALVVASLRDGVNVKADGSLDVSLMGLQVYKPMTDVKVDIVESSVLKWTLKDTDTSTWNEIYVTETLHTDTSQIIQKWISALLNFDLEFNDKYFTSTFQLPLIMRNSNHAADLSDNLTALVTPTRVMELASNKRSSVIVRRGFRLSEEQSATMNSTGTLQSTMTNISSILSLKRERPDELVVVLQLDYDKVCSQKCQLVIFNSLKALGIKFHNMKICIVDTEGFVKTCGAAEEMFCTVDDLMNSASLPQEAKFEPVWLKSTLYADGPLKSLGIAVVSNTCMDSQTSCLLRDYSCFTNVGRRRPKELKIKVGYLNLDYSDKIGELIEVESWDNFLEALTYSFGLTFGDDDDEGDMSAEEQLTDSGNEHDSDAHSISSIESTTTILIASPFDSSESNARVYLDDNENSHFVPTSYSSPLGRKPSSYSQDFPPENISNRSIQEGCDFLLEDIERAIHEIDQVSSPSHAEEKDHTSVLYQYI